MASVLQKKGWENQKDWKQLSLVGVKIDVCFILCISVSNVCEYVVDVNFILWTKPTKQDDTLAT